MADGDRQWQESNNTDSKQYGIDHQDWRKSKAQSPGLDADRPPSKGRGRGWRTRARESPSEGTRQTEKETTTRDASSSGNRKEDRRHTDDRWEDAERVEEERRKEEKRRQEQRRKDDERQWEEDRGWKGGKNKDVSRPRPNTDGKESASTEKSRKPRRAAQEIYVPRARRQPQELYVPRAKRLQMEAEEKTKSSTTSKEIKKTNVTREPPHKRRMVTGHKQQQSSHQEIKSDKSVGRTSQASELGHKSDLDPDTSGERQASSGQTARTDNSRTIESRDKDLPREGTQDSYVQTNLKLNKQSLDHFPGPEEQRGEVDLTDTTNQCKTVPDMQSGKVDKMSSEQKPSGNLSLDDVMDEDCNIREVSDTPGKFLDQLETSQAKEASECLDTSFDQQLHFTEHGLNSNKVAPVIGSSSESAAQSENATVTVDRIEENRTGNVLASDTDHGDIRTNDTNTVYPDVPQVESPKVDQTSNGASRDEQVPVCDIVSQRDMGGTNVEPCVSQDISGSHTCQTSTDNVESSSHKIPDARQGANIDTGKLLEEKAFVDSCEYKEKDDEGNGLVKLEEETRTESTRAEVVEAIEDNQMEVDSGLSPGDQCPVVPEDALPTKTTDQIRTDGLHPNASANMQTSDASPVKAILDNAAESKTKEVEGVPQVEDATTTERTTLSDSHVKVEQSVATHSEIEKGATSDNGSVTARTESTSCASDAASHEPSASLADVASDGIAADSVGTETAEVHRAETDTSGDDAIQGGSEESSSEAAEADDEEEEKLPSSQEDAMEAEEQGVDGDEAEEDSWDAMFDESGECLKPEEEQELADGIGKVKVSIKKPKRDYYNYQPKDNMDYSAFEHVIEVYDFPAEFKTPDLVMAFSDFKNKGFDIKWVDDTHALAIFATPLVAQDALCLLNPMFRTRPLSLATRESKMKAKRCIEFLQPYKSRPETTAAAARRLVSGALGLRSKVTKEQREAERQKLRKARDKKRADKQQTQDVWEGNV